MPPTVEERPNVDPAYAVPNPGSAPAQSYPELRDIPAREENLRRYREEVERRLGYRDGNGPRYMNETEAMDTEFYREGYDTRPRLTHEPDVVLDEHQRVQEINALYLDQSVDKYAGRVVETEAARDERKYGRGPLGCLRRWFSETDAGKAVHVAGKLALAGAATALPGPFAPAGILLARKLGTDAILEGVQYAFERPVLQNIRELRIRRHEYLMQLMGIRNELANRDDDHDLSANARITALFGNSLHDNLIEIIEEFDRIELQILEREQRLALIKTIGKSVRTAASLAWSATAIYNLFHEGLLMNLDAGEDPTSALSGMDAATQAEHVIGGEVYHHVKPTMDGLGFVYEHGEIMGNYALANGGEIGSLGKDVVSAGLGVGAFAGAALYDLVPNVMGIRSNNQFRDRMYQVRTRPHMEENKADQAVFTLTERDHLDSSSGVAHEISDLGGLSRDNDEFRRGLEFKKQKLQVGAIMRVPATLIYSNAGPIPPFVTPDTEDVYIQVLGWDERRESGKFVNLSYIIFDPERNNYSMTENNMINGADSVYRVEAKADEIIDNAERVADSYADFIARRVRAPREEIDRLRQERGIPEPANNQTWRANNPFTLNTESHGPWGVAADQTIQIESIEGTRAQVIVRDAGGTFIGRLNGIRLEEVLANAILVNPNQEREEKSSGFMKEINDLILKPQGAKVPLQPNLLFTYHDHNTPGQPVRWVGILSVDDTGDGDISFVIGDMDPATNDIPAKAKKASTNLAANHLTLEAFRDRFNARNNLGNYLEELRFDTRRMS